MKREDLRVKARDVGGGVVLSERPATDADLAALGYVKLDVDVDRLRDAVNYNKQHALADVARQVLAALDGEET